MERKMATVRVVDATLPIEGADAIEVAVIGGWKVVVKKGEYQVGDLACYCEIDSFIPSAIAPFLTKEGHHPKTYNGVEGERLRTIKLRGQISQGLLLPFSVITEKMKEICGKPMGGFISEGEDVSELLGITKWEPPAEFQAANTKGSFPHFIPKTDQERIQNLKKDLERWNEKGEEFQVTEKMDGSSMTVFIKDGEVGVCSRNLELKDDGSSTFWETAKKQGLVDFLLGYDLEMALQGELVGGSIQGNTYKVDGFKFFLYDVFNIETQEYLPPLQVEEMAKYYGIQHVPVLDYVKMQGKSIEDLLHDAEGKSQVGVKPEREGLVFKSLNGKDSFKVISNKWLLKTGG